MSQDRGSAWTTVRIVAFALAATPLVCALVGTLLVRGGTAEAQRRASQDVVSVLMPLLGGFGVLVAVASHPARAFLARRLRKEGKDRSPIQVFQQSMMIGMNLAEVPAVCGVALAALSGTLLVPAALWAIAFVVLLTHLPPKDPPAEADPDDPEA